MVRVKGRQLLVGLEWAPQDGFQNFWARYWRMVWMPG
jgi:hypothetical protein